MLWYVYPNITSLMAVMSLGIILGVVAIIIVPYLFAELKCYSDSSMKRLDQESELNLGILLIFLLVFLLSISIIFYFTLM
jgi:hypothetical protein